MVALIDKPDGVLRPITLFRAIYRLHAKARAPIVRTWSKALRRLAIYMAQHRQVLDGTYRLVVRQHISQTQNPRAAVADLLWDLRKAYENVLLLQMEEASARGPYKQGEASPPAPHSHQTNLPFTYGPRS